MNETDRLYALANQFYKAARSAWLEGRTEEEQRARLRMDELYSRIKVLEIAATMKKR